MAQEEVIFAGSGGNCSSVIMWSNPMNWTKPLVVSQFPKGYSVYALVVSPNATRMAAGTRVKPSGLAKTGLFRVFSLADYRASENMPALFDMCHPPAVFALAFCTEDILASGGLDGKIKLWSVSEHRQLAEIVAHPNGVFALRRMGSLVLASVGGDGILRAWDMDSLKAKYESEPFDLPKVHALTCLDYDPRTGLLIHPSHSGELHVYDARNDFRKRVIPAHCGDFSALSYGSNYVVTAGSEDAMIKLWSSSLDRFVAEASSSAGTLAVGWAGATALMAASADGSGRLWEIDNDRLISGRKFADLSLRSAIGLPATIIRKCRAEASRRWRDEKIAEAKQLMAQPERQRELAIIIEELCQQEFSAEAALILADAARTRGKLLWELDSRLALAEGLGDSRAALPSLYALGTLLQEIKEAHLARRYFEKILRIDRGYRDVKHCMRQLDLDLLVKLSPEKGVRGDLLRNELVLQELEKHTILKKKFSWRIVLAMGNSIFSDAHLDERQVAQSILEVLTEHGADMSLAGLSRAMLFYNGEVRDLTWIYVPSETIKQGIAFAMEIRSTTSGSTFVPYRIFDPTLLGIPPQTSVREHNQQIENAWRRLGSSSGAKAWLDHACLTAMEKLGQLASEVMTQNDEF